MANPQIQSLVEAFVNQIEAAVRQDVVRSLQSALGAATGGATASPRKVGRPAGSKKSKPGSVVKTNSKAIKAAKGKRIRRSPAQLEADVGRVVAFVKSNPGATSEKVRAALALAKPAWLLAFKRGIESKQLIKKGEKRSTQLFPAKG